MTEKPSRDEGAPERGNNAATAVQALAELQTAAARAAARFDWEAAIALTTQALALPDVPPDVAYELLDTRSVGYRLTGRFTEELADQEQKAVLAGQVGNLQRQVRALGRQVDAVGRLGDRALAQEIAERALALSEQTDDPETQALGQVTMGLMLAMIADIRGLGYLERALRAFQQLGDEASQARCWRGLSAAASRLGPPSQASAAAQKALELYRRVGDREGEGSAFNMIAIANTDRAQARAGWEQALIIADAIGNMPGRRRC